MPPAIIKICGITDEPALDAALDAQADMVGFVFFARSPRNLTLMRASELARRTKSRAARVALTVDADDAALEAIVAAAHPDWLQLHGTETPDRVAWVKRRFGVGVLRALSIGGPDDLARAEAFGAMADLLLFDAPARGTAQRPGGNGAIFDWSLLRDIDFETPWLLAGGLDVSNVAAALAGTGAAGVDVSSGVERSPGVKDPALIAAFVAAARAAAARRTDLLHSGAAR